MRASALFLILAATVAAQTPDPHDAIRAAMAASIHQQRESVRRQAAAARPAQTPFLADSFDPAPAAAEPEPLEPGCEAIPPDQMQAYIERTAQKEGITPDLLRAVIGKESSFRPCAISPKGAQGLMQLMPATARELGVDNPFDPQENMEGGARFLRQLLSRYGGDLVMALAAYNAGPGRVDAYRGLPPIPETMNYVSDILETLRVPPVQPLPSIQ